MIEVCSCNHNHDYRNEGDYSHGGNLLHTHRHPVSPVVVTCGSGGQNNDDLWIKVRRESENREREKENKK